MWQLLDKLEGGEIIGFVAVLGGLLTGILAVLAAHWRSVRLAELEASLKQQMLARGMSAAEIEQVLRSSAHSRPSQEPAFTGVATTDKAELVKVMAEHGIEGGDMERVLRAFDGAGSDGTSTAREKARAVSHLLQNGHDADAIVQVLRAFPSPPADGIKRFA